MRRKIVQHFARNAPRCVRAKAQNYFLLHPPAEASARHGQSILSPAKLHFALIDLAALLTEGLLHEVMKGDGGQLRGVAGKQDTERLIAKELL